MKTIAIAAIAAFTMGSAYAAQPTLSGHGSGTAPAFVPPKGGAKVLLNQTTGGTGNGIVSQNFESSLATYDSADADAFAVPTGTSWKVSQVVANGVYFNGPGPATSENVTFYADVRGKPGKPVKGGTFTNVVGADASGAFTITLPKAVKLKGGKTYWVSVVANLAYAGGAGGEWGWEDATQIGPEQADWENPGGGFGTTCTKWGVETTCIPNGQANGKSLELLGK